MEDNNPYQPADFSFENLPPVREPGDRRAGLNGFEKFCAVLAFGLAIALLLLGIIGLFTGCTGNFTLPPVLGVLPALIGWGTIRAIMKSW